LEETKETKKAESTGAKPKSQQQIVIWILLAIIAVLVVALLWSSCQKDAEAPGGSDARHPSGDTETQVTPGETEEEVELRTPEDMVEEVWALLCDVVEGYLQFPDTAEFPEYDREAIQVFTPKPYRPEIWEYHVRMEVPSETSAGKVEDHIVDVMVEYDSTEDTWKIQGFLYTPSSSVSEGIRYRSNSES